MPASETGLPFDDIRDLIRSMPAADEEAAAETRRRETMLTKPEGSLGRLEAIAEWLAAWQGKAPPRVSRPLVAVFAANHGVARKGVSAYPIAVTEQMVANFSQGGGAINQICRVHELGLKVYELALEHPTGDITEEPAMSEADCAGTMAFGMEATAGGIDLLCIGEMGIGNTTVAAAIFHGLYGGAAEDWVGRGTGVDDEGLGRKRAAVAAAVERHRAHLGDPLELLRRLGGREVAAMAGAILAARMSRIPVVIDGYVASAAAAVLHAADPRGLDHCLFGHLSAEPGHRRALERMGKVPLLDLGMRLGEGTGAALAAVIVKTAAAIHGGMATFAEAGVAEKGD